jgi:glycosyltransferase
LEQQLKQDSQAALFEMLFEGIQPVGDMESDYRAGIPEILEHEETWEKLFYKSGNKKQDHLWSMTGFALGFLKHDISLDHLFANQEKHSSIYIFNRKRRAAEYGIGTYINELTTELKNTGLYVSVINLDAERSEFVIEEQEGIQNWYIPSNSNSSSVSYNDYNSVIIAFMQLYIRNTENLIFQLNFMEGYPFAQRLRETFDCKLLLVVHYMGWSFTLNGNLSRMREILGQPENEVTNSIEKKVLNSVKEERKLLEYVDHIVCLADYAREILCRDYGIKADKVTVVNNGLSDKAKSLMCGERSELKEKYKIDTDEKIILYAGRLDEMKGVSYLIKAFRKVLEHEPNCRLWIAGDGAYNPLFREAEGIWSKLCFTGQVSREQLFELYQIADIGVMPSIFEPFGYVAVEMMICGLPVVATATSGLDEIVEDRITGFKVGLISENQTTAVDVGMLAQKLIYLLHSPEERERMGRNGRKRYLDSYCASMMGRKMEKCYRKLFQDVSVKSLSTASL